MTRGLFVTAWLATLSVAYAQPRTFEVASIRANPDCGPDFLSRGAPGPTGMFVECADLRDLILAAYGVYADNGAPTSTRMQVLGGPRWMDTQRFDIRATAAAESSQSDIFGPMLRALLEERFRLKVHLESKEGQIYKLVARGGTKLKSSPDATGTVSVHPSGTVEFRGVTMSDLCGRLGMVLDREVTDASGLDGRYDFQLKIAPSDLNPRFVGGRELTDSDAITDIERGSSIFSALRELGLNLESARGPVHAIVVDQIESLLAN